MTYLVVLDNVVQALFGPAITTDHESADLLFPREAHRFVCRHQAQWRAAELPAPVAQERRA